MTGRGQAVKRKRVSVNNKTQEVSDPKRKRVLLSTDLKTRTYSFWYRCMKAISKLYNPEEQRVFFDINWSCQIMAIFYSAHSMARQIGNGSKTMASMEGKSASFNYNGSVHSKPLVDVYNLIKAEATEMVLEYKKFTQNTEDNWISIASAIFTFCQNFKNRMKEVRVGHSKIQVGKTEEEVSYVASSDYGLEQAHHVLLEGSSYPPQVKSSAAQSLGPGTLMIMVTEKGSEPKYGDKWKDALTQCLGTLPDKDLFVRCLSDTSINQNRSLIQLVCDILLLTTSKQIHRAYMAPCFLMVIMSKKEDIPDTATEKGRYVLVFDESMPKKFNNTGRGLFASYQNKVCSFRYRMRTILDPELAAQLCFHSVFGTYTDNLNVLNVITDRALWATRNQFGDRIKGLGAELPEVIFDMPKFKFWAKMCTAMQTPFLGNTIQEVLPNSAFSGPQALAWNKTMKDYYNEKLNTTTSYQKPVNAVTLKEKYMIILQEIVGQINVNGGFTKGSTTWHKVEGEINYDNHPEGNDADKVELRLEVPVRLFLSGDQE